MSFDNEVPSVGDTVRVVNTDSGEVVAEGSVRDVERYEDESDDAVYMEVPIEPDDVLLFKWGYWNGEEYSWARKTNYGGPEVDVGEDCFEYSVV